MKKLLFGLFMLLVFAAQAQPYSFTFQQEYFFGNLPAAKTEAMGRIDVPIGGMVNSLFFNAAGLGRIEKREVSFSTSAPFYLLRASDFYFLGYAERILPDLVAAISINQMAVGPTTFSTTINGTRYDLDNPKSTNLALSVAYEPLNGLHIGVNTNLYLMKFFDEVNAAKTLHLDAGALYRLTLSEKENSSQHLQFGLSFNNFTGSAITFASPVGDEASNSLPVIARAGIAYLIVLPLALRHAGTGSLDLTFATEYMNLLNNPYRTSFQLGAEAEIWDVFALRLGFLTQNIDDMGFASNKDRLTDFTYGFGFIVPLRELTHGTLPLRFHFDYVSLKQPPFTVSGSRNPNMRSFSFRVVWPFHND